MYKVKYLGDVMYFDTLESLAYYYGCPSSYTVDDIQYMLEVKSGGMCYPIITEIDYEEVI